MAELTVRGPLAARRAGLGGFLMLAASAAAGLIAVACGDGIVEVPIATPRPSPTQAPLPAPTSTQMHPAVASPTPVPTLPAGAIASLARSLTPAPSPTPTSSPGEALDPDPVSTRTVAVGPVNRIAFVGEDDLIYTIEPDGSGLRQVSPPTADVATGEFAGLYTWPVWSPDGGSLLFSGVRPKPGESDVHVALYRAPAVEGEPGAAVAIFVDHPTTVGIGPGAPHYASWSPDGESIAVIAGSADGLYTALLDSEDGGSLRPLVLGTPVFHAWSPDSTRFLVHLEDRVTMYNLSGGFQGAVPSRPVEGASVAYFAPDFAPNDSRYAVMSRDGGQAWLEVQGPDGSDRQSLTPRAGSTGFKWSPDGDHIAIASGDSDQPLYNRLALVEVDGGGERTLAQREMFAFWWSPDGKWIATADRLPDVPGAIEWTAIAVETGEERLLAKMVPTADFSFAQTYFTQYAQSHQIWSPDSRSLVLSGLILTEDLLEQARSGRFGDVSPEVWVVDIETATPRALARGTLAFWSPR